VREMGRLGRLVLSGAEVWGDGEIGEIRKIILNSSVRSHQSIQFG